MTHSSLKIAIPSFIYLLDYQHVLSHGALSFPPSRQWFCSGDWNIGRKVMWDGQNAENICRPTTHHGNSEGINFLRQEWAGVNQGEAAGYKTNLEYAKFPRKAHIQAMGNGVSGTICNAGKSEFDVLNDSSWTVEQYFDHNNGTRTNSNYPVNLQKGQKYVFEYTVSAPHVTIEKGYIDFYITKGNWNPEQPLTWKNLERYPFCTYTPLKFPTPLQTDHLGYKEKFYCKLPDNKAGKHVIFSIWQRADSPEAFYSCSDVFILGGTEIDGPQNKEKSWASLTAKNLGPASSNEKLVRPKKMAKPKLALVDKNFLIQISGKCLNFDGQNFELQNCTSNSSQFQPAVNGHIKILKTFPEKCWEIAYQENFKNWKIVAKNCVYFDVFQIFKFDARTGEIRLAIDQKFCLFFDSNGQLLADTCSKIEPAKFGSNRFLLAEN